MIEVQDEILNGEPRYRIIDSSGNIILDNINIEMITSVQQDGTPINKVLFDSIKSGNDLIQKVNVPQFELGDEYNFLKLNNVITQYEKGLRVLIDTTFEPIHFDKSIIPVFTSSQSVQGFSISNPSFSTDFWKIADGDRDTYGYIGASTSTVSGTISFPFKIKPTKIYVKVGSTDTWYIDSLFNTSEKKEGIFEIDTDFKTSITVTRDANGSASMYSFEILEGEAYMFNPYLYTYININGLGNILIDKKLGQNKKYELVYDGTMFIATEVA